MYLTAGGGDLIFRENYFETASTSSGGYGTVIKSRTTSGLADVSLLAEHSSQEVNLHVTPISAYIQRQHGAIREIPVSVQANGTEVFADGNGKIDLGNIVGQWKDTAASGIKYGGVKVYPGGYVPGAPMGAVKIGSLTIEDYGFIGSPGWSSYLHSYGSSNGNLVIYPSNGQIGFNANVTLGNTNVNNPPSAQVVVYSDTHDKGFLTSRLTTTQKMAISSPAEGLQVYDLTLHQMSYYNGTTWVNY
jgi:hypothetical protein